MPCISKKCIQSKKEVMIYVFSLYSLHAEPVLGSEEDTKDTKDLRHILSWQSKAESPRIESDIHEVVN
jgi:hypothetical protein